MKLGRQLLAVAVVAAGLAGCTTSNDPAETFPTFFGTWAGHTWEGSASAFLASGGSAGDTLYIFASNPPSSGMMVRESLMARIVVHGTGAYPLGANAVRFDELVGGDVVSASYVTTPSSTGTLTLSSYRGVGGLAEGKIEFDAVSSSPYGSYGPSASMRDAYFSVVVRAMPKS
jgi:hypothetical protein